MKLSKAIELNKESEKSLRDHKFIDHADAVQLGIEALERISTMRSNPNYNRAAPLPGETPEIDAKRGLHMIKKILESPGGEL